MKPKWEKKFEEAKDDAISYENNPSGGDEMVVEWGIIKAFILSTLEEYAGELELIVIENRRYGPKMIREVTNLNTHWGIKK